MKIQELIDRYKSYEGIWDAPGAEAARKCFLRDLEQLDTPHSGHAEEAPRYVKNVLARLRELPLHDREVWLKAIMSEFEQDFSFTKWREGYEQGKFEGVLEREKATIPQMAADWIEVCKDNLTTSLYTAMTPNFIKENGQSFDLISWIKKASNQNIFARAWLDGYEVKQEKRYLVKIRATKHYFAKDGNRKIYFSLAYKSCFTKKELEKAGFGWVFSCEGIEIEEVEDDSKI